MYSSLNNKLGAIAIFSEDACIPYLIGDDYVAESLGLTGPREVKAVGRLETVPAGKSRLVRISGWNAQSRYYTHSSISPRPIVPYGRGHCADFPNEKR